MSGGHNEADAFIVIQRATVVVVSSGRGESKKVHIKEKGAQVAEGWIGNE